MPNQRSSVDRIVLKPCEIDVEALLSDSMPNVSISSSQRHIDDFQQTLAALDTAPSFSKFAHQSRLLSRTQRLLRDIDGIRALYTYAADFDKAGVFLGTDWDDPSQLEATLARATLNGGGHGAVLESLSELRLLAIAEKQVDHARITSEAAQAFVREVVASNLDIVFPRADEAARDIDTAVLARTHALFAFVLERLGMDTILAELAAEIELVMKQRPIVTERVESLLEAARQGLDRRAADATTAHRLQSWIAALHGPSALSQAYPQTAYIEALTELDPDTWFAEAGALAQSMDETGLVCAHHGDLVRYLASHAPNPDLLSVALGLDAVGQSALRADFDDILAIVRYAIHPSTSRSIYGLSRLLNAGLTFWRPLLPGLKRLMRLSLHPRIAARLVEADPVLTPEQANIALVAGTLSILGQPRGLDQGYNPTCQSARAISLWAQNDPGYLLELIASAARDDDIVMDFEGTPVRASLLDTGMAETLHTELDTVSLLLTPYIDRIYVEMGRRTIGRPGDGHRWINVEMHGWWVYRDFAELIDIGAGAIANFDAFIRLFYAAYHPFYNGDRDLVFAQPCGIAATDATGAYIGWHAIAIQRVAQDTTGVWRVYFFNPNRDKRQNWGQGIETSVVGADEREGESSLPFEQFASRVYVFHYKSWETGDETVVDAEAISRIRQFTARSWGRRFAWHD